VWGGISVWFCLWEFDSFGLYRVGNVLPGEFAGKLWVVCGERDQ